MEGRDNFLNYFYTVSATWNTKVKNRFIVVYNHSDEYHNIFELEGSLENWFQLSHCLDRKTEAQKRLSTYPRLHFITLQVKAKQDSEVTAQNSHLWKNKVQETVRRTKWNMQIYQIALRNFPALRFQITETEASIHLFIYSFNLYLLKAY
jgi:hypothetical protein